MSQPQAKQHSSAPANDRIGVMPDLRGIIQHLRAPVRGRDDIIRAIVFGAVAQDGPGFVWTPGGGLTPVGPRVDRTAQSQSSEKRDLLLGLTIYELAGFGTLSTARLREVMSDPYLNTPCLAAHD